MLDSVLDPEFLQHPEGLQEFRLGLDVALRRREDHRLLALGDRQLPFRLQASHAVAVVRELAVGARDLAGRHHYGPDTQNLLDCPVDRHPGHVQRFRQGLLAGESLAGAGVDELADFLEDGAADTVEARPLLLAPIHNHWVLESPGLSLGRRDGTARCLVDKLDMRQLRRVGHVGVACSVSGSAHMAVLPGKLWCLVRGW